MTRDIRPIYLRSESDSGCYASVADDVWHFVSQRVYSLARPLETILSILSLNFEIHLTKRTRVAMAARPLRFRSQLSLCCLSFTCKGTILLQANRTLNPTISLGSALAVTPLIPKTS